MLKTTKQSIWEVTVGLTEKGGDLVDNWTSKTVLALSFDEAVQKAKNKLRKNEYIHEVHRLREVDIA